MNKFDFKSVMHFVGVLNTDGYPSGDLAELRRMDHEAPKEAAFWKLFADLNEESRRARVDEIRWATVIKGISLMLPGPHLTKAAPGKFWHKMILARLGFQSFLQLQLMK